MQDLDRFRRLMFQEMVDRAALARMQPMSDERIQAGLDRLPVFEEGLLDLLRSVEETRTDLEGVAIPRTREWCSDRRVLPLAVAAQFIREAIGLSLLKGSVGYRSYGDFERAAITSDLAYGVDAVMRGVISAVVPEPELGEDRSMEVISELVKIRGINLSNRDQDEIMGRLLMEDALQINYLSADPSGTSLVDYWVRVVRELVEEEGWDRQPALRIGEFVVAGAELARKAYGLVYPQVMAVLSNE